MSKANETSADKVRISITAEQRVSLSKTVEMTRADYEAYERALRDLDGREMEETIAAIANRYGFYGDGRDIDNAWDPEEITFTLVEGE